MPSKSKAQHRLMQAVAHGWQPRNGKIPPSVAEEFLAADKRKGKYQSKKK